VPQGLVSVIDVRGRLYMHGRNLVGVGRCGGRGGGSGGLSAHEGGRGLGLPDQNLSGRAQFRMRRWKQQCGMMEEVGWVQWMGWL